VVLKPLQRGALYDALAAPARARHTRRPPRRPPRPERPRLLVEDEPVNAAVAQGYLMLWGDIGMGQGRRRAVARNAASAST